MTVFLDDILVGSRVSAAEMQATLIADPNSKTARYLRELQATASPPSADTKPAKSRRKRPSQPR